MSDKVCLKLTGSHREAFDRLLDLLTSTVTKLSEKCASEAGSQSGNPASQVIGDVSEVAKGWIGAKLEKPDLENRQKAVEIAETCARIEEANLKREILEIEKQMKLIELENAVLDLNERRVAAAVKWLGLLRNTLMKDEDGNVVLLLSDDTESLRPDTNEPQSASGKLFTP